MLPKSIPYKSGYNARKQFLPVVKWMLMVRQDEQNRLRPRVAKPTTIDVDVPRKPSPIVLIFRNGRLRWRRRGQGDRSGMKRHVVTHCL